MGVGKQVQMRTPQAEPFRHTLTLPPSPPPLNLPCLLASACSNTLNLGNEELNQERTPEKTASKQCSLQKKIGPHSHSPVLTEKSKRKSWRQLQVDQASTRNGLQSHYYLKVPWDWVRGGGGGGCLKISVFPQA